VGKYGTDYTGLGAYEGGVNIDKGANIISTNSDGETALLFGPAALREIQAGCANGDFAIPPDNATEIISDENPLPYWTYTDVNSAGAITAAVVTDSTAGSGNVLRFTVAASTPTGKSATLTRYISVASTLSRSFSYYLEASFDNGSATAFANVEVSGAFYNADLTATSGSFTSGTYAFSSLSSPTGISAPANFDAGSLLSTTAPSDAAYLLVTITISTTGTTSGTVDLGEVNLYHGSPEILLTDRSAPQTYQPAVLQADGGELLIQSDNGNSLTITATTSNFNNSVTTTGNLTADGDITANGVLSGSGETDLLVHGVNLQRTTTLTINTSTDASATAITWSSAVKNTSLYAYWSSGSTIAIPLTGWYNITCHLTFASGTGYAARLYALIGGTVIAESEMQAAANTTNDTVGLATIAYLTAGNSLVFRASASSASKTIGGSARNRCSVVYIGDMSV